MKKLVLLLLSLYSIMLYGQPVEFNYICPIPDSKYLNPEQDIILKTGYPFDPVSIHDAFAILKGSESGFFGCVMSLSADRKTLFIHHSKKFALGEIIHVFVSPGLRTLDGRNIESISFDFRIRKHHLNPLPSQPDPCFRETVSVTPGKIHSGHSLYAGRDNNLPPDYPAPTDVYLADGATPGYTFLTPSVRMTPQYSDYLTILDKFGIPVYYERKDFTVFDFKVLDNGLLTYAKGANQNAALKRYYLMDDHYNIVDSVLAGNGYYIDNHDMQLLDNGHYLIIIYDPQVVDMSQIVPGGHPEAIVTGLVIQEVDNQQNVYFQWRSWDHFQITDATDDISLTAIQIDYVHANALDIDSDGNILLSSRHLDEITKIDFSTGDIIWRFGLNSENNMFTIYDDPVGFSHQHDIRRVENGNYTLFDNGNLNIPQLSKGLEYQINEQTMEATLVWDYLHLPSIYAASTGSARRFSNGNTLIGWGGSSPYGLTEVTSAEVKVFEMTFPTNVAGYRALKYDWNTALFTTQDNIGFGNYVDNVNPKEYLLLITNNHGQAIQINSAHNHLAGTFFVENLPLTIQPGASAQLRVYFQPEAQGTYEDVLTLNYDNYGNTRRVARQLTLYGLSDPSLPSLSFDPENGATEVDPYEVVTVTFSEPVRKAFGQPVEDDDVINLFIFKESNLFGASVSFHGTINEDKTVMTLIPDTHLKGNQQYYVQLLPNKLADYQNNVVDYPDYCFFTTGDLVDVQELHPDHQIQIYPNPLKDHLVIQSGNDAVKKVDIFSEEGRMIFSQSFDQKKIRINMPGLHEGLLTIRVYTESGQVLSRQLVRIR